MASRSYRTDLRLGPEVVPGVLVPGIAPYLRDLAVSDMEDLDGVVLKAPAFALGANRRQRNGVVVVGDHVVHRDGDRPPAGLECAQEPSRYLMDALVVAAERAFAGEMPPDVVGEEPPASAR